MFSALIFYPMERKGVNDLMRALVVYYSHSGNTKRIRGGGTGKEGDSGRLCAGNPKDGCGPIKI